MNVLDLWIPIVVTGIATHIISTLAWTVLPHHKPEWQKLPDREGLKAWIEAKGIAPGQYIFPHMSEGMDAMKEGCTGTLVLWDPPPSFGAAIAKTLTFFFVAAFVIGYIASHTLPAGSSFMEVFRLVTTVGLLTHCAAHFPGVFWFPKKVAMELLDGVAFAVATGLIFAALWPAA